jgi:protein tyrosine phosphatase (PTP) superfamily phosphohydrolase (DUF442 family)
MSDVREFFQLAPDIATSGQPTREQFADIAAAGYQAVVNLALPTSDNAIADEGAVVTSLGMTYFHVPVIFENPTGEDLRLFLGIMHTLEGRQKWVHCALNKRVSAFCYHYMRHVRGADEDAARSPILNQWAPEMEEAWKDFIALAPEPGR